MPRLSLRGRISFSVFSIGFFILRNFVLTDLISDLMSRTICSVTLTQLVLVNAISAPQDIADSNIVLAAASRTLIAPGIF